jgi:hypothetical protein
MSNKLTKADLRIGNILNYDIAEGDTLPTRIDWQDLKWISEDEVGFNLVHSPIPLTNELLLQLGFEHKLINGRINTYTKGDFQYRYSPYKKGLTHRLLGSMKSNKITYVHQLQNLYFALTNQELTTND